MAPRRKRRQYFVDPQFQGALIVRCVMHWVFCMATAALLLLAWRVLENPGQPNHSYIAELWLSYWRVIVVSVVMLLVVMRDFVMLSNRLCGPLMRMRNNMQRVASGEQVESVHVRDADFWHEFAEEFNAMVARAQQNPPPSNESSTSNAPACHETS